jgi:CBS domain containing-hemolysin-like protein
MEFTIVIGVVLVLLFVAAITSMSEAAIMAVSRVKALHLAEQKKKGSDELRQIVDDPAPYMSLVVFCMVLAHVTATVLAAHVASERLDTAGDVIAISVMTFLIFVVAEIVPKMLVLQRSEAAALAAARRIYRIGRFLKPLGRLLVFLANAPMAMLPGQALKDGPFRLADDLRHGNGEEDADEEDERELIHSVFEFGDTVVREVMVPRTDMVVIKASSTLREALDTIIKAGYSRIPIYERDLDDIVAVLYAKDLLKKVLDMNPNEPVADLARDPLFVPEQKKVADLLREMQEQRIHMALVVDEYGGTAGLVTIEDLIEEIVGEIVDEYDQEEPLVEAVSENRVRVSARLPIDEVNDLLDVELPQEEWDTVGGLVFGLVGRVPRPGESVTYDGLQFTTERVAGRRIQKVLISKIAEQEQE